MLLVRRTLSHVPQFDISTAAYPSPSCYIFGITEDM